jgi:hypothetical protein
LQLLTKTAPDFIGARLLTDKDENLILFLLKRSMVSNVSSDVSTADGATKKHYPQGEHNKEGCISLWHADAQTPRRCFKNAVILVMYRETNGCLNRPPMNIDTSAKPRQEMDMEKSGGGDLRLFARYCNVIP